MSFLDQSPLSMVISGLLCVHGKLSILGDGFMSSAYRTTTNVLGEGFVSFAFWGSCSAQQRKHVWTRRPNRIFFWFEDIYGATIITLSYYCPTKLIRHHQRVSTKPLQSEENGAMLNHRKHIQKNIHKDTHTKKADTQTRRMPHHLKFVTLAYLQDLPTPLLHLV